MSAPFPHPDRHARLADGAALLRAALTLQGVSEPLQRLLDADDTMAQAAADALEANFTARSRMTRLVELLGARVDAAIDVQAAGGGL